jgi:UDP-N-acetylmuramoyl-tripeptide--D-alanyl-D-alanine ligase
LKLETAVEYMNAQSDGLEPALAAREIESFVIDSREASAGSVFFALSQPDYKNNGFNGDFDDATKFVVTAFENGAAVCVVRHDRFEEHKTELDKFRSQLIFADDTIVALQSLAHGVYTEWNRPVVAITGSAGKTTAKELTAHVLSHGGRKVLRNIKNYNNGLGHPLTVLNLAKDPTYDIAVLEMGMSTPMNEIARLCKITPPDVSVVLNVLPVHVEHLGSIENVAKAKAEIVEGMKADGTAVLNIDDERVAAMSSLSKGKVLTFGIDKQADVMASGIMVSGFSGSTFELKTPVGSALVKFPLNGRHNILNALAAAAVGTSFGMSVTDIAEALRTVEAPPQRGEIVDFKQGFTVINDSYNSNPDALLSMVETLITGGADATRKIVVAGEMLELGANAAEIHRETGRKIAESEINLLIGVRGLAAEMIAGAADGDLSEARFAADSDAAGEMLASIVQPGDAILIKGSRGVRTEKVLEKLLEKFEAVDKGAAEG